jgi:hypothetical protein
VQPGQVSTPQPELRKTALRPLKSTVIERFLRYSVLGGGLVLGFVLAKIPSLILAYLTYAIALEGLYLYIACAQAKDRKNSFIFAGKLQLNAFVKILKYVGAVTLIAVLCDYWLPHSILPHKLPEGMTVGDVLLQRSMNFFRVALVLSVLMSISHVRSLRLAGFTFDELASGQYLTRSLTIPAQVKSVEAGLALRLQQLRFHKAPRFTRLFIESVPRVREVFQAMRPVLVLYWPLCPTAVELTVQQAESGTIVRLNCRLRSGGYLVEILPLPREATALLNFLTTNLADATDSEMRLALALRKQDEFKHLAVEAQLRMLQTQIEPHFLFNTLANVQELYRTDLVAGEEMLNNLTAYFRGAVEGFRSEQSTMAHEVSLAYRYLAIMQTRMGERLTITPPDIGELGSHPVPPAMLITLVENAIKHGISPKMSGTISIRAMRINNQVRLQVTDDGAGFSSVGGTGMGLSNLRQRLTALYGAAAGLEIEAGVEGGFKASIILPYESGYSR